MSEETIPLLTGEPTSAVPLAPPDNMSGEPTSAVPLAPPLDLSAARKKLASLSGPKFWRGVEELTDDVSFQAFLQKEFPRHASEWDESLDRGFGRRRFLELGMASLGLAGLTACTRQPLEKIVPYVKQPEEIVPGVPLLFATAMPFLGYGWGLLAESHEGRPTKVEGNPEHPSSLGAAHLLAQASVLGLYDPDRSRAITKLGTVDTWARFVEELTNVAKSQKAAEGEGLRIVTGSVTSPSLGAQIKALLAAYPKARWVQWEAAGRDNARAGARIAFGQALQVRHDLTKADVVLAVESDFLASGPASLRDAKDFVARRRLEAGSKEMSRLYVAESAPSPTGTLADHRVAVRASAAGLFLQAVGAELGAPGLAKPEGLTPKQEKAALAAAKDLKAAGPKGAVLVGDYASPAAHAAALLINQALGSLGSTVLVSDPVEVEPVDHAAQLKELVADLHERKVTAILLLGVNPVYDAAGDLAFSNALIKAPFRAHLGLYADETAAYCPWHVPEAHYLEAWGDVRAHDGTTSIVQPLIEPLYGGHTSQEILSVFLDETPQKAYEIVHGHWLKALGNDEKVWRRALHDGVVAGTALLPKAAAVNAEAVQQALAAQAPSKGLEVTFRPDPCVFDGRFANSGWLQELPKPLSKLTWDNAAFLAPATAQRLGVTNHDLVSVKAGGGTVTLPVVVQPGQAEDVVAVHLGFGRTAAGRVGNGVGVDVAPIRSSTSLWVAEAQVAKTGTGEPLSHTQQHFRMESRHLLRVGTLPAYQADPRFASKVGYQPEPQESLYPAFEYDKRAWGMVVDLNACTGCNACVIACQAENNIPVVGKEQVRRNREMQWIRIDQYYEGASLDDPQIVHQPVMCQHCEMAPCEVVCPVAATVHGAEGLNEMAYNRCVGTRYCSNNCPYKVRRFNFFEYNGDPEPVLRMLKNPDVTVRSRGVMEKCTYCIQRINRARIVAEREGRPIKDGEIVTACQQTCPTEAIVFGDLNDKASAVARRRAEPRTYYLLDELHTRPRTSYLAKVRNPNPELEGA